MACLLLSSAYAGNLKGFLTQPPMMPKIETFKQVHDSGLPIYWPDYGSRRSCKDHIDPIVREVAKNSLHYAESDREEYAKMV